MVKASQKVQSQQQTDNSEQMKSDDSDDGDHVPIFTPEVTQLKEKELNQPNQDDQQMEEDIDNEGAVVDADKYQQEFSDSDEDKEDFTIRKSDSLIVAATAEADHSNLEVYIYDHKTSDLYVHHEIILGAYPLCLEWLSEWQGKPTNHIIVGTFLPEIEIWNLDSENCEPTHVLGNVKKSEEWKNRPGKKGFEDLGTHTDAIMCLSINPLQKEYLASGSADTTVRIWDLDDCQCKAVFNKIHKDKVQAIRWNLNNDKTLLTAGYDSQVNIIDVRDVSTRISTNINTKYKDIEQAQWHPSQEHNFAISTESGVVLGYDTRKINEPVFSIAAHNKQCTSLGFSKHIPNMMCTSSTDGEIKVWDILNDGGAKPLEIASKNMKQGELFTMQFCQDIPWIIASGGSNGQVSVWDLSENKKVEDHFKGYLIEGSYDIKDYNKDAAGDEYESMDDMEDEDENESETKDQSQPVKSKKHKKSNKKSSKKE